MPTPYLSAAGSSILTDFDTLRQLHYVNSQLPPAMQPSTHRRSFEHFPVQTQPHQKPDRAPYALSHPVFPAVRLAAADSIAPALQPSHPCDTFQDTIPSYGLLNITGLLKNSTSAMILSPLLRPQTMTMDWELRSSSVDSSTVCWTVSSSPEGGPLSSVVSR